VAYWNGDDYPYYWPGEIHAASEAEEEWSKWTSVARYAKLDTLWLSLPELLPG